MKFDRDAAMKADVGTSIVESGNYIGQILKCSTVKSEKGAKGLSFNFISDQGLMAKYVTLWTISKDGKPTYERDKIMALMGILNIEEAEVVPGVDEEIIPAFHNKRVGFGLQKQEYFKGGDIKWSMKLIHFYHANSMQTYAEKINNQAPKVWDIPIVDKPAKVPEQYNGNTNNTSNNFDNNSSSQQFNNMPITENSNDDLPF